MKRKILIDFCDLGPNHSKQGHFLYRLLSERFDLELCDEPDFLVHNVFGQAHRLNSGIRIQYTWEGDPPDYRVSDYSLSPLAVNDPRHFHLPGYVSRGPAGKIIKREDDPESILARKTKFCSFIVSGHSPRKNRNRLDFFNALCRYKRVDSAGRFMNNTGGHLPRGVAAKIEFLRPYKFNICFENAGRPGYATEKIYDAMVARCLPIYWGDPLIAQQFNPRSFLNRADFPSDEALVEKIIELDQDDAKYLDFMREPYLPGDKPTVYFSRERIQDFFEKIFTTSVVPVARRRKRWIPLGRWMLVKRHPWHRFEDSVRSITCMDDWWGGLVPTGTVSRTNFAGPRGSGEGEVGCTEPATSCDAAGKTPTRNKIHIDFCDIGPNHAKLGHLLYRLLSERFDLELCGEPDYLVHNVFGHTHHLNSGVRIQYTWESNLPDYRVSDYSVGPLSLDDARHLHLPGYVMRGPAGNIIKRFDDPEKILAGKTKFCSFVVSGYNSRKNGNRLDIFNAVSRYKRVDSAGRFINNIGGPIPRGVANKVDFLRPYKFNICYENAAIPGYATEKLYDAMAARCLPIYWGDPMIAQQFNPRSFLNRADFPSDEALAEKIVELDQDDAKYLEFMREPYLPGDKPTLYFSRERILDFFERIFAAPIKPAAQRRKLWFRLGGRLTLVKRHPWHRFGESARTFKCMDDFWPGGRGFGTLPKPESPVEIPDAKVRGNDNSAGLLQHEQRDVSVKRGPL